MLWRHPEVKGHVSPWMWRMQSAQDQPLRSLGATNGKEEEADAGEKAELATGGGGVSNCFR